MNWNSSDIQLISLDNKYQTHILTNARGKNTLLSTVKNENRIILNITHQLQQHALFIFEIEKERARTPTTTPPTAEAAPTTKINYHTYEWVSCMLTIVRLLIPVKSTGKSCSTAIEKSCSTWRAYIANRKHENK